MSGDRIGWRGLRWGLAGGLSAWLGLAQAQTDASLDFRFFDVPTGRRIQQNPLQIRWLLRADAESHCEAQMPKDGHARESQGCVYWHLAHGQCTVVTTERTTHSVLGHLYLHCLTGS